jgi:hypothetical protein
MKMKNLIVALYLTAFAVVLGVIDTSDAFGQSANPSQYRWALVIGNGHYDDELLKLPNAPVDADAIAKKLEGLGFKVTHENDVTKQRLKDLVSVFQAQLKNGGAGLFYYSGHAFQLNGNNYLLPIEGTFTTPSDLITKSVAMDLIFSAFQTDGTSPVFVILDACRNNPFVHSYDKNDWVPGLAPPRNAPPNTLIAYATDPGSTTEDGVSAHSPYTQALLQFLGQPGMSVEDVFKNVRKLVHQTRPEQVPWENTSLKTTFRFREPVSVRAQITDGDDDVFVFLNGTDSMSWGIDGRNEKQLDLRPGENHIVVKVYNQRTFTGGVEGLGGHLPEGWRYQFLVSAADGSKLLDLRAREDHPQKDGPRHGHIFTVATAALMVDDDGALSVPEVDADAWTRAPQAAAPTNVSLPAIAQEAHSHIDWCITNETHDPGMTNCVPEYLQTEPHCILGGGRSCILSRAINAAKSGNCSYAFRLTRICQCHNTQAQAVLDAWGQNSVCDYLKLR